MTKALLDCARQGGWDVTFVDTSDHRGLGNVGRLDIRNVALALGHIIQFVCKLAWNRPDTVYLPLSQGLAGFARDAALLLLSRLTSARVVIHAHGGQYRAFYRRMPTAGRALMRLCLSDVDVIVVLADCHRAQFEGWASPRTRVVVVPNGIEDEWPNGPPRRDASAGKTVLFLGNLHVMKGFMDVLQAVPAVLSVVPQARFVFAGGPRWDERTSAAVREQLRNPVVRRATVFAGVVGSEERHQLLEKAEVLVFPPRWEEGQGLVVLEAMSAGLPVVATASGGLSETVRADVEALVVPRSDPDAVAAGIVRLLQQPDLRTSMGKAARERFESEYTLDLWMHRMSWVLERDSRVASQPRDGQGPPF
jgi:glycosyltransferase involved in cell wall biosynthesis